MVRLSTAQALSGIRALVPGFLAENPEVAFALQRARFQAAAAAGDGVRALKLARAELAPLAQACPHLLPQLKVLFAPPGSQPCLYVANNLMPVHLRSHCAIDSTGGTVLGIASPRCGLSCLLSGLRTQCGSAFCRVCSSSCGIPGVRWRSRAKVSCLGTARPILF